MSDLADCRCCWERPPRDEPNRKRRIVEYAKDCKIHKKHEVKR